MPGHQITISEMAGESPLTITLFASSLPEKGLAEERRTKSVQSWYPGNPEATLQILAIEDQPVVLKGLFSNRETGTAGFADAMRRDLFKMQYRGRRLRLLYRDTLVEGHFARLRFNEIDDFEIEYEIEFQPVFSAGQSLVTAGSAELTAAAMRRHIADLEQALEQLPEEIRMPPPVSTIPVSAYVEPERIPPVEFILDPWLTFRIQSSQVLARARQLASLSGNESAIKATAKTQFLKETAIIAANTARRALDADPLTPLSVLDTLTRPQSIAGAMTAITSIRDFF